ncbi:MAG: PH domain-containing protein [Chloroflexi bacterium]|nr:PH domain-containing protein [Chloroflexota bacterium]
MPPVVFRPRTDPWLFVLLLAALGSATAATFLDPESPPAVLALILAIDALVLWVLVGSRYVVTSSGITVVFGPVRLSFPFERIARVRRGGWWAQVSSFRTPRLRLAFSHRNLVLDLRTGMTRELVISPAQEADFLEVLHGRAPHILVEAGNEAPHADGGMRASEP